MSEDQIENEFSRIFNLDLTKKFGTELELKATKEECQNLAKRFSIPKVDYLKAKCVFKKMSQKQVGDYRLSVELEAAIIQQCVMTLSDINESIAEKFSIIFQNRPIVNNEEDAPTEIDFDAHEEDIEFIEGKEIDAGQYIAQYLSLAMNPYPRQSTVVGSELGHKIMSEEQVSEEAEKKNPFSVLKDLKHKT